MANKGVIENPPVGGSGGAPFRLLNEGHYVKHIRVWYSEKPDSKDPVILRAIQVVYSDGTQSQTVGTPEGNSDEFSLGSNSVKTMTLWSGDRVDTLRLTTQSDFFEVGGKDGKKETEQHVGNGTLKGFIGGAAMDIDRLGTVFETDD